MDSRVTSGGPSGLSLLFKGGGQPEKNTSIQPASRTVQTVSGARTARAIPAACATEPSQGLFAYDHAAQSLLYQPGRIDRGRLSQ